MGACRREDAGCARGIADRKRQHRHAQAAEALDGPRRATPPQDAGRLPRQGVPGARIAGGSGASRAWGPAGRVPGAAWWRRADESQRTPAESGRAGRIQANDRRRAEPPAPPVGAAKPPRRRPFARRRESRNPRTPAHPRTRAPASRKPTADRRPRQPATGNRQPATANRQPRNLEPHPAQGHPARPRRGSPTPGMMAASPSPRPAMKKLLATATLALVATLAAAATAPYDEHADAKAQIQAALHEAAAAKEPVLLVFGANWCPDCRALDRALHTGRNAELIARDFKVVKIDVGNWDHNLDIAAAYGNPIKKGIPAAVIVSPDNRVLFATRAGELADARRMSDEGIYEFFSKAAGEARLQ